ncbi:SDH family Clp fold serine proteinase [Maricaulis sp. CAU 1757]
MVSLVSEWAWWGGAGALALVTMLTLISMTLWYRQRARSDVRQVSELRRRRHARYEDARREYEKYRRKIETGNTVLIDLIHDLGEDLAGRDSARQQIAFDEAFEAVAAIRQANPRTNIKIVLHTLGGYARPAHMIAQALKRHVARRKSGGGAGKEGQVIAYVPYVAMSGGTMIALAADRVVMDETASLGPIDTIYGGFPTETYRDLLAKKGAEATQDVLLMLAHEAEKYDRYAGKVAREIVNPAHKKGEQDHALADHLASGTRSHSEAISPAEAKALGMRVSTKLPESIAGLVDARIRMINTRVEYEARREADAAPSEAEAASPADQVIEQAIRQSLRGAVGLRAGPE